MEQRPVRACVFDAYGTLFDVHAPVAAVAVELGENAQAISRLWRTKQLEYTWLRSLMGRYVEFSKITADSLDYALSAYGVSNPALRDGLLSAYRSLAAYPDAVACLEMLRRSGMRTGILSNGSPHMLASAITSAKIGALLDYVLSVDTVQIYKPSPRVYQLAVNAFGVEAGEIAFVSANAWDCAGAASFGFSVIHVNRFGQPEERLDASAKAQVTNLADAATFILKMAA